MTGNYGAVMASTIPSTITRVIGDVVDGGRDLIFGDIHGHIDKFKRVLERANYNSNKDRIILVGDLIDRGPASAEVVELLHWPNVVAVRGNHEHMFLCAFHHVYHNTDPEYVDHYWADVFLGNGGGWSVSLDVDTFYEMYSTLNKLPFYLVINRNDGSKEIVVHSQLTARQDVTLEEVLEERMSYDDLMASIWERGIMSKGDAPNALAIGVDRIYCGHTPSRSPTYIGNYLNLDTGAAYGGNPLTCYVPQESRSYQSED